jgi:hypothetical protein
VAAVVVFAGSLAFTLASAPAAFADDATSITFSKTAQSVAFGSDWWAGITVTSQYRTLDSPDGTVDVYADGATTPFVGGLSLFRGGMAYLTPAVSRPPLAAGTHTLTAIYRPSGGSGLISSQTAVPLTITVTPLELTASAALDRSAASPTVDLSLSGAYVDALSTPSGNWTVDVTDAAGRSVFSTRVVQPKGQRGPLSVDLGNRISAGDAVTITTVFSSPDAKAGAKLTQAAPVKLVIPGLTPVQFLSIPMPWWYLAISVLLAVCAAALLIVQIVRSRRRRRSDEVLPATSEKDSADTGAMPR